MRFLFLSHTNFGSTFVVGSHHLARELGARGHHVCHVSAAVDVRHLAYLARRSFYTRLAHIRPTVVAPNVVSYVPPALLPMTPRIVDRLEPRLRPHRTIVPPLHRTLRRAGFPSCDAVVIDHPVLASAAELFPEATVVYRPTDVYVDLRGDPHYAAVERRALRRAHLVVATSSVVAHHIEAYEEARQLPIRVCPNGVQFGHFSSPVPEAAELVGLDHPRLIYVGAIDARLDVAALDDLARARPGWSLVIVGAGPSDLSCLRRRPNVHVLGTVPYDRLPALLQHADLGLLPLSDHPGNDGRSPMKLYEYLAAGLPVVCRNTMGMADVRTPGVARYSSANEMVAVTERLLGTRPDRPSLQAVASTHDWGVASESLVAEVVDRRRRRVHA